MDKQQRLKNLQSARTSIISSCNSYCIERNKLQYSVQVLQEKIYSERKQLQTVDNSIRSLEEEIRKEKEQENQSPKKKKISAIQDLSENHLLIIFSDRSICILTKEDLNKHYCCIDIKNVSISFNKDYLRFISQIHGCDIAYDINIEKIEKIAQG